MLTVLLFSILATLAFFVAMPFLIIFFEVVGGWYDSLFDRLERAAARFCARRGWY